MRIGFLGCGNMAGAIMSGIIGKGLAKPEDILSSDVDAAKLADRVKTMGITGLSSNQEVARYADVLFLAVKPQFYPDVIADVKDIIDDTKIVITIAPGKTLAWLYEQFGRKIKLVRTMPNTPAMVGEGMTAAVVGELLNEEEKETALSLLRSFSRVEQVPERLMDCVTSVSGSSPAYVFMFIEAMADAAVMDGMPRPQAYQFAAQAVLGSAKMVLETGKHPGELKDMVCSPAGTTIAAVRVLEEKGFRSAVIEAMQACTAKSKSM